MNSNNSNTKEPAIIAFCGDTTLVCVGKINPFDRLSSIFERCNYCVINLETTILDRNKIYIRKKNKSVYLSIYEDELSWLVSFRFKKKIIFSIANNHILDYGLDGLQSTINFLEENSIKYIPLTDFLKLKFNNQIINLLSSHRETDNLFGFSVKEKRKNINDKEFSILVNHEGLEHVLLPSNSQKKKYRQYIDMGFDVVVGHHSHTPQGIEYKKDYIIAYSLGNFNFIQPDIKSTFINRFSYILMIEIEKNNIRHLQIPYVIDNDGIPSVKNEKKYIDYLGEINRVLLTDNIFVEPVHSSYPYLKNNIVGGWIPRLKKNLLGEIMNLFKWFLSRRFIVSLLLLPFYFYAKATKLLNKINKNA